MSVQSQATHMPKKEAIVDSFYIHWSIICLLTFVLRSAYGFPVFLMNSSGEGFAIPVGLRHCSC